MGRKIFFRLRRSSTFHHESPPEPALVMVVDLELVFTRTIEAPPSSPHKFIIGISIESIDAHISSDDEVRRNVNSQQQLSDLIHRAEHGSHFTACYRTQFSLFFAFGDC